MNLLLYFLIVICFVGALGTLIPVVQIVLGSTKVTWLSVHHNLATYVIGIAVTAFADCIVCRREEDNRTFTLFLLGLTLLSAACAICVLLIDRPEFVWKLSAGGAFLAAIVWLMVHDADPELTEDDAFSALGGKQALG